MSEVTKEQVVDYLSSLPVIEVAGLVKELEEKWGVSAAPTIISGGGPQEEAPKEEEKTEFDVVLDSFGGKENKMKVIKAVKDLVQLGLKESKEKVESAPVTLVEGISKEAAEDMKSKIEAAGGVIVLK